MDHEVARRVGEMVRYAVDLVVLCRTREESDAGLTYMRTWTEAAVLSLHPTKTRIVNAPVRRKGWRQPRHPYPYPEAAKCELPQVRIHGLTTLSRGGR